MFGREAEGAVALTPRRLPGAAGRPCVAGGDRLQRLCARLRREPQRKRVRVRGHEKGRWGGQLGPGLLVPVWGAPDVAKELEPAALR